MKVEIECEIPEWRQDEYLILPYSKTIGNKVFFETRKIATTTEAPPYVTIGMVVEGERPITEEAKRWLEQSHIRFTLREINKLLKVI